METSMILIRGLNLTAFESSKPKFAVLTQNHLDAAMFYFDKEYYILKGMAIPDNLPRWRIPW
jgi:hypothetical protein